MSDFKFSTEPFLDSDQAAAILRIHPKTLQRLADTVASSGTVSASSGDFTVQTLRAGMMASFPHSTPTLPSGTL